MSDIVEKLREPEMSTLSAFTRMREAATAIEAQRAEIARLRAELENWHNWFRQLSNPPALKVSP